VASVTGYNHLSGTVNLDAKGLETGQSHAVVIPFDNVQALFGSSQFINTQPNSKIYDAATVNISIKLSNQSFSLNDIGNPPYNPFIIIDVNSGRGREAHLAGKPPTDLADLRLFGTRDDVSDIANGIYYKDANGMPWALNIPAVFHYPYEDTDIRNAYLDFNAWATSGGTSNQDWYSTHMNSDSIYSASN